MKNKPFVLWIALLAWCTVSCGQSVSSVYTIGDKGSKIVPAAMRMPHYLPMLEGKTIAVFSNHTSLVGKKHLVDTLLSRGVKIKKIFSPEHGFRGTADAGEKVSSSRDAATGISVVSLYGKKRKPTGEDLKDIDLILFDIQDVGVRFYTYISSLEEIMEAGMEHGVPVMVLDRPNPNGFYVDGPVLQDGFRSFVGMQRVPVVYGMTIGEYARMLEGEKWLDKKLYAQPNLQLKLTVIPCLNYSHSSLYELPVKPSPNLPDMASVYLYPSTCFFEGTVLNEGRGTDKAFQQFGHPLLPDTLYSYVPESMEGAKNPKLVNTTCYGWFLGGSDQEVLNRVDRRLQIKWLQQAYNMFPGKDSFFINNAANFNRLAGSDQLLKQLRSGATEQEIRRSWKKDLDAFSAIRKKYLLYKDFE